MNESPAQKLHDVSGLMITQNADWSENFIGFERCNKYKICDENGNILFVAAEYDQSFLLRNIFESRRPFDINIIDRNGDIRIRINRPFIFYFSEITVSSGEMQLIGAVKKKISLFNRQFSITNKFNREILSLFGPLLHPWTFEIQKGPRSIDKIQKKWSGLLKESFSNADNFGVSVPASLHESDKALLLGAVFLIDFEYFEKSGND